MPDGFALIFFEDDEHDSIDLKFIFYIKFM